MARLPGRLAALAAAVLALTAAASGFGGAARAEDPSSGGTGSPGLQPAGSTVVPVVSLPPSQLPESVTIDRWGNLYLSLFQQGQLLKITPGGARSVLATFPEGSQALGVRLDADGNVYAAVAGPDSGVWRVAAGGGTPVRLAAVPGFPNGLAFDGAGRLYVSDSIGGTVYRISRQGTAVPWSRSPLLAGTTGNGPCGVAHPSGLPLGANGLAFGSHGDLLAANTTRGTIVRIPVLPGGRAGPARVFAGPDCRLWGADGIAAGSHGTLYAAANASDDIVRISPAGALAVIAARAAGDPLSSPSDIAFGPGWHDRAQIFISNFALFHGGAGAGVVRADLAEWPLP
jgi:hypothetical protein